MIDSYFSLVDHLNLADQRWWRRYMRRFFDRVTLAGASVLDVGGGDGRTSFYAAAMGAERVVCLEPMVDGSNEAMQRAFDSLAAGTGLHVELRRETFQEYQADEIFDVIVLNNSINHLDEQACIDFGDPEAGQRHRAIFGKFADLAPHGHLVIADAARRNAWGDTGRRNPFAPSIEWAKHLQPSQWARLAATAGFASESTSWTLPRRLGRPGAVLLSHPVGGYLINSHFVLHLRRAGAR